MDSRWMISSIVILLAITVESTARPSAPVQTEIRLLDQDNTGTEFDDGFQAVDIVDDDKDLQLSQVLGESIQTGNATADAFATLLKSDVGEDVYTTVMSGAASSATCGDGKREGAEECDDGNTTPNDGCNAVCKVEGGYQCLPE